MTKLKVWIWRNKCWRILPGKKSLLNVSIIIHVQASDSKPFLLFSSGKDCLLRMLSLDPAHRLAATEVLNHPWVTVRSLYIFSPSIVHLFSLQGELLDPDNGPRNVLEMMKAWGNQLDDDEINTSSAPESDSSAINTNNHSHPEVNIETSSVESNSGPPSRNGSASSVPKVISCIIHCQFIAIH
jgi:serine/threonine protein kinase